MKNFIVSLFTIFLFSVSSFAMQGGAKVDKHGASATGKSGGGVVVEKRHVAAKGKTGNGVEVNKKGLEVKGKKGGMTIDKNGLNIRTKK